MGSDPRFGRDPKLACEGPRKGARLPITHVVSRKLTTMTIPASAKAVSFVVTRDRAKAIAFYGTVLGFRLVSEDTFAAVFDMNGTMLRISTVPGHRPAAHTVLGWEVTDIVGTIGALTAKGAKFTIYDGMGQDSLGIWRPPGSSTAVAWFLDPDGNNLSITQF
jgi:catechol 2,3-dioxygenase-like lactoylglutathione lyase family enzyme